MPSNFNKLDFISNKRDRKIIKILNCNKHGNYLAKSSIEKCPICKNTCIIEKCENKSYIKGYCLYHLINIPKTFTLEDIENNKNKPRFKIVLLNCNIHGLYLGFTPANECPICKNIRENKCNIPDCNNKIYKLNLCKKHFYSIEANFDKNNDEEIKNTKKIFLLYCEEHGYYLANSSTTNCYKCQRNCIIKGCYNLKYNGYTLCKEHLLSLPNNFNNNYEFLNWIENNNKIYVLECEIHEKYIAKGSVSFCPVCENKCQVKNCNNQKINNCVCKYHYNILPTVFNKLNPPYKICICECSEHGLYLSGSGIGSCPICYDILLNNYINKIDFIDENNNLFEFSINNKYDELNKHGIIIKDNRFYEKDSIIDFLTSYIRKFNNFIPNKIIITNLSISEYIMKIKNIIIENFSENNINTIILNNEIHETINLKKFIRNNVNNKNINNIKIIKGISKIDYIIKNITMNNKEIKGYDLNILEKSIIPGVWGLKGISKKDGKLYYLTAGQSINLYKEIKKCIRIINTVQDDPEKAGRWDIIQNGYKDFKFEIVAKDINDFNEREKIEMIYATKFNCIYWQSSITQLNSVYLYSNKTNS